MSQLTPYLNARPAMKGNSAQDWIDAIQQGTEPGNDTMIGDDVGFSDQEETPTYVGEQLPAPSRLGSFVITNEGGAGYKTKVEIDGRDYSPIIERFNVEVEAGGMVKLNVTFLPGSIKLVGMGLIADQWGDPLDDRPMTMGDRDAKTRRDINPDED